METIVNRQLMNHLERQQLLTPHHFEICTGLGTADALQALLNVWLDIVGKGGAARILAADIAGAFDRVSHVAFSARSGSSTLLALSIAGYRHILMAYGPRAVSWALRCLIYVYDAIDVLVGNAKRGAYADDTTIYILVSSAQCPRVAAQALQISTNRLH